jgi:hypothetical protein
MAANPNVIKEGAHGTLLDTYGTLVRFDAKEGAFTGFLDHSGNFTLGMIVSEESSYVGEWWNNAYDGFGRLSNSMGVFRGELRQGVPHGIGEFVPSNSDASQRGMFKSGDFFNHLCDDKRVVSVLAIVNTVCETVHHSIHVFVSSSQCHGEATIVDSDPEDDEPLSARYVVSKKSSSVGRDSHALAKEVNKPVAWKRKMSPTTIETPKKRPSTTKNAEDGLSIIRHALLNFFDQTEIGVSPASRVTYRRTLLAMLSGTAPADVLKFLPDDDADLLDFIESAEWTKEFKSYGNGSFSCGLRKLRPHMASFRSQSFRELASSKV